MIDSFPFDSWLNPDGSLNTDITSYWTFGPAGGGEAGDLTGTFVLTALGMLLMVASLIYWVWLENKKLNAQATHLRAAGGLGPAAGEAEPTGQPQA